MMKLDSSVEAVKTFIEAVKTSNSLVESYNSLADYIRVNVRDFKNVNLYFNRMRCHIHESFSNHSMLPYLYFV